MADTPRFCAYCGQPVEPGDLYCAACGRSTSMPSQPGPLLARPVATPPPPAVRPPAVPPPAVQPRASLAPPPPLAPPPLAQPARPRRWRAAVIWLVIICAALALVFAAMHYKPVRTVLSTASRKLPIALPSKGAGKVTALVFNIEDELADRPLCNCLAAGTAGGEIHVFDIPSSSQVESFKGLLPSAAPITSLSIGPVSYFDAGSGQEHYQHEYIAVAQSKNASVVSWDVRLPAGRRLLAFSSADDAPGGGPLQEVSYDCSGDRLWAFDIGSQSACRWDCSTGKLIHAEARPAELPAARSISCSVNWRYTVVEYATGGIEVFDAWGATGGATDYGLSVCKKPAADGPLPSALAVSSLGYIAAADGTPGAWYVELTDFVGHAPGLKLPTTDEMTALAFSYQGDLLAGGGPGYVILWDARSGKEQCRLSIR